MPVYLTITAESRRVKIGFTAGSARRRLAKMQTDNHERVTVIRWLNGDEATEDAIQSRYQHLRIHGDWFAFCDTMLGDLGAPDVIEPPATPRHPLVAWLKREGMSMAAFAARVGVTHSAVSRWASGEVFPPGDKLILIRRETGGKVSADDFMPPHDEAAATQRAVA